ncbi:MAG: spore germination protein [Bacillota bacterium]|nr:spore germination protein [Bacillota bacterium]
MDNPYGQDMKGRLSDEDLSVYRPSVGLIKEQLSSNSDVFFRDITVNSAVPITLTLVYADGVADQTRLSDYIIKPLVAGDGFKDARSEEDVLTRVREGAIYYGSQFIRYNAKDAIDGILADGAAIIFDKLCVAVTFDIKGFSRRTVNEPAGENIIKGGKDTLVEAIRFNTATIRSRLKTSNLAIEEFTVGRQSKTKVAVIYIRDITNPMLVDALKKRLSALSISDTMALASIEENLKDVHYTMFPQFLTSERPDKICSDIAEGRVCIIIDGIPIALIAPVTLASFMQGPEDYTQNAITVSLVRIMRYILMAVAIMVPGLYIAVMTFNIEMIPTNYLMAIVTSRQGVPFTIFFEALVMLFAFEILLEAGLRLPKITGQAVSIVGGIIVGQAAITAKLVSPGILVVVALSVIAGLALPNKDMVNALRVWRLVITLTGGIAGLFGIQLGFIMFLYSLARIETLGVPYLAPFAGIDSRSFGDTIVRMPMKSQKKRPEFLKTLDQER